VTQPAAPAPSATVLLVDDEAPIRRSLGPYLERGGYRVLLASDGAEAMDILASYQVDIIVSDVLMPRMDGRELVRRVRAGGAWTPIILLTQVDASYERVSALDDGADDYLSKPFDPAELASRIRAVLRRTRGVAQPLTSASQLVAGELLLERTSRRVTLSGREVTLTPKATMLLDYLMSHPGELHTRDALLASLWGIDFATSTRAVDHRLREIRQAPGGGALGGGDAALNGDITRLLDDGVGLVLGEPDPHIGDGGELVDASLVPRRDGVEAGDEEKSGVAQASHLAGAIDDVGVRLDIADAGDNGGIGHG